MEIQFSTFRFWVEYHVRFIYVIVPPLVFPNKNILYMYGKVIMYILW